MGVGSGVAICEPHWYQRNFTVVGVAYDPSV